MKSGSWSGVQSMMHEKSRLEKDTGKLINSSMTLAESSVDSKSRLSTIDPRVWMKAEGACGQTSVPDPVHPVNCCCLTCSMRLHGESPPTRSVYHRLVTNEAGNAQSFARMSADVVSPRGKYAGIIRKPSADREVGAGQHHPQLPHGYLHIPSSLSNSSPTTSLTKHTQSPGSPERAEPESKLFWQLAETKISPIKHISLSRAVRGGVTQSLLFTAKVEGLSETLG